MTRLQEVMELDKYEANGSFHVYLDTRLLFCLNSVVLFFIVSRLDILCC
jgi:hypothetical protein